MRYHDLRLVEDMETTKSSQEVTFLHSCLSPATLKVVGRWRRVRKDEEQKTWWCVVLRWL